MSSKKVPDGPNKFKTAYDYSLLPELICSVCGNKELELSDFVPHRRRIVGYRLPLICIPCNKTATLERNRIKKSDLRRKDPEGHRKKYRDWQLKATYNITQSEYMRILESQGNTCAICRNENTAEKDYHVDHDHSCCEGNKSCGECVRGLLCNRCNLMIGLSKDDPATLRSAIEYLEGTHS